MAGESPVALLYDGYGKPLAVRDGYAFGSNNSALLLAGHDGDVVRVLKTSTDGYLQLELNGATINLNPVVDQGAAALNSDAWPVKISDSISTVGISDVSGQKALKVDVLQTIDNVNFGTTLPLSGAAVGFSDGINMQPARVFDVDTNVINTQYVLGVNLRQSAEGGSVELGTNSNPVKIDPTGITTQPISATSLPLPAGAATETTLSALLTETTFTNRINTLGQKTMTNSTPVVLASDQAAISVGIIEGAAGSAKKVLYDITATVIYIGSAEQGTDPGSAAWLIKKTTLDVIGNPVSTLWSSTTAVWNDRTTETYN